MDQLPPPSYSDSDSDDSDATWSEAKVLEKAEYNLKMEASGFYQTRPGYVWEKKREGQNYFGHDYSEEQKAAYRAKHGNEIIVPSASASEADSEETYNPERDGDWKEYMKRKLGI